MVDAVHAPQSGFLRPITGSFAQFAESNPAAVMMRAGFASLNLDWDYVNSMVTPDDLPDAVRGVRALGWTGFNVSRPHKESIIEHLDLLTERAQRIGAVNVVTRRASGLTGDNTDGAGLLAAMKDTADPRGQSCVVIGSGGAARSIALETLNTASRIEVVNRTRRSATDLASEIRDATGIETRGVELTAAYTIPRHASIVVNATPIGGRSAREDWSDRFIDSLDVNMTICDVVTNPSDTGLMKAARIRGCRTVSGREMLIHQGALTIEIWTGDMPSMDAMSNALLEASRGTH